MLPLVLVALCALAGTATLASVPNLKSMVLRLSDLPAGFALDYSRAVSQDQVVKEQGFVMPGYVTGWETQFTRGEGSEQRDSSPRSRSTGRPRRRTLRCSTASSVP